MFDPERLNQPPASHRLLLDHVDLLRNGDVFYYNGVVSMRQTPSISSGNPNKLTMTIAMRARPTRVNA